MSNKLSTEIGKMTALRMCVKLYLNSQLLRLKNDEEQNTIQQHTTRKHDPQARMLFGRVHKTRKRRGHDENAMHP